MFIFRNEIRHQRSLAQGLQKPPTESNDVEQCAQVESKYPGLKNPKFVLFEIISWDRKQRLIIKGA